ncbi:hypothetical protein [Microbacterium sp. JZ31]|uniref:hypothetical protein n=1 Tax=Microbacterium sp. JZ31 TaxID=1906274 RepID=UPI001933E07D|nr:hypothetical protein [Microbacterium sp. JZ31]
MWAKTNPSLGTVIREDKIVDELNALQARPDVFRRERLGEWGRSGDRALALDESQWAAGHLPEENWPERDEAYSFKHGDVRVIGVDCTFNAEMTTLTEMVPLVGNRVGIRVLDAGPGLEWVARVLGEVREETAHIKVVLDPARTGDLTPDLREVGISDAERRRRVELATGRDLTLACEALVRQVREGHAVHNDPRWTRLPLQRPDQRSTTGRDGSSSASTGPTSHPSSLQPSRSGHYGAFRLLAVSSDSSTERPGGAALMSEPRASIRLIGTIKERSIGG